MPVSQGSGRETGSTSFRPQSIEQAIAEPKFRRKEHRPHLEAETVLAVSSLGRAVHVWGLSSQTRN